ncbi:RIIa domain-containing protein 1 isoform X1 [Macaca fascicularis]|uniref:RIIa domain-containing protein 1 isoform X1 n=1 Tax=Macaca fascicularis TaxID=9541 RepID=UPI001E257C02|nr:RIIa domain-containing protein 1 isoform X1 [Macaca fascicularis]
METPLSLLRRPDPGVLSAAQLEQLRKFKIQTRIANEKYLRTHKEVEWLISGFFRNSLQEQPGCLGLAAVGTAPDTSFPFLPCSCQGQRNIFEKTRQHPRICCRLLHGSKTSQQNSHAAN